MGLLRVLLAITVVVAHSDELFGLTFTGALVAVQIFFMISGFYMALVLHTRYSGDGVYFLFLSNRFLRLFPIYWVTVLLTVFASVGFHLASEGALRFDVYSQLEAMPSIETMFYIVATNVLLIGQDLALFMGLNLNTGELFFTNNFLNHQPTVSRFLIVPQAWTLSLEIMFYLLAPILVRKHVALLVGVVIASLAVRAATYFYFNLTYDPWTYRFFPSELALFILGTLSYRLYTKGRVVKLLGKTGCRATFPVVLSLLLIYQFLPFDSGNLSHLKNWGFYLLMVVAIPCIFEASKSSRIDSRIGELSYPIYISHWLVIIVLTELFPALKAHGNLGEISTVITLIISCLLVRFVSDPVERIRRRRALDFKRA